jgi:hypothetical protein
MSESYAHRLTKQTLATWLRARSRIGANFKGLQPILPFIPLSTDKPMYGVYEEYPVCKDGLEGLQCECQGNDLHTTGWHCFEAKHGKIAARAHKIPTKKDIKKWKQSKAKPRLKHMLFFDIGIVGPDGKLCCVFEIKHTHPTTDEKVQWIEANGIRWFEISADWILNRCRSPFSMEGAILKPHRSYQSGSVSECVKCKQEISAARPGKSKHGRWVCDSCTFQHRVNFCTHPDCVSVWVDEEARYCAIHKRILVD